MGGLWGNHIEVDRQARFSARSVPDLESSTRWVAWSPVRARA